MQVSGREMARDLVASLRLRHWIKNALVFVPLVLGGRLSESEPLTSVVIAFFAIGLAASAGYLVNDLLDAPDDRRHWSKKDRPIARGALPAPLVISATAALHAGGFALAVFISWQAAGVLLAYVLLSLAYSHGMKRVALLDGFVLACLFTLRLALGVVAAQVPPSPWLFVFSMFLFSSLTYAKRLTELQRGVAHMDDTFASRGYCPEDKPLLLSLGVAAGIGSVIILTLYIIEDAFRQSFYGNTAWLWSLPPIVFLLICRIWLKTARGKMHDDPVAFVLGDRVSLGLLMMLGMCFYMAWMGM